MRFLRHIPAVLLVPATVSVVWAGLFLPPPLWILKYGPSPGCEPTGRTWNIEDVEFVEIGRGYDRIGSDYLAEDPKEDYFRRAGYTHGDLVGRIVTPLALSWGRRPKASAEMPVHWVEFPRTFALAATEVTNADYERFDPRHRRHRVSEEDTEPVVNVSWGEARRYCEWLAKRAEVPVRLPTGAEWEVACRCGSREEFEFARGDHGAYAWTYENSRGRTRPTGTLQPSPWGFHDLHGNVWEWCADRWHGSYEGAPSDDSAWTEGGSTSRVRRGGGYGVAIYHCRAAVRSGEGAASGRRYLGVRLAFTPPDR